MPSPEDVCALVPETMKVSGYVARGIKVADGIKFAN